MKNILPRLLTISCLLLFVLVAGCKKDEKSAADWGELASAKRNEMLQLSANISCSEQANVSVQEISNGCSAQYYAIRKADLAKYEQLRKEYLDYTDKQYAAWYSEGLMVEPCYDREWMAEQPIRLECKDNKVVLITSLNVDLAEAPALINTANEFITNYLNAQTCTGTSSWAYAPFINYEAREVQFIPYLRTSANVAELAKKVSLYNRLNIRLAEKEGKTEEMKRNKLAERVDCVDGKPVVVYRD